MPCDVSIDEQIVELGRISTQSSASTSSCTERAFARAEELSARSLRHRAKFPLGST